MTKTFDPETFQRMEQLRNSVLEGETLLREKRKSYWNANPERLDWVKRTIADAKEKLAALAA